MNLGSYKGFLGTPHRPLIRPASVDHFFRPGCTYSRRSQKGFSVRILPADTIFHDKGPGIFVPEHELLPLLAVLNSAVYWGLLGLQMVFGFYEIGVIQKTPMPDSSGELAVPLGIRARRAWAEKRSIDMSKATSHAFLLPSLLTEWGNRSQSVALRGHPAYVQVRKPSTQSSPKLTISPFASTASTRRTGPL
jgi:hypothetical protein